METALVRAELRAVVYSSAAYKFGRMLHVQHLVVQHVFEHELGNACGIERSTYDYCAVHVIVMAQNAARLALAPR